MIYIIGSGLSGIAAAAALVKRGYHPTILDGGLTPAPEVLALKARLASVDPESWNLDDLDRLRRTGPPYRSGIPQKLSFGSDFAYRDIDSSTSAYSNQATLLRSFAQGGFSNVWGAVVQTFPQREFQSWPVSFSDVSPHYAAIRQMIRRSDAALQPSSQARALHNDLAAHREELEKRGIHFDYATLAVRTVDDDDGKSCRHCGLCLYGCPYDSIYNDLYPVLLQRKAGALSRPLRRWIRAVSERLFVSFGYLHSEESSLLRLIYTSGGNGRLHLEGEPNPESRRIGRSIAQKLLHSRNYLRALTLPSQLKFDIPGAGLRSGGCFPMRRSPAELETDVWGRVPGLPHMHIVDSSVLPTLPAGPVAFTVMANAHRIALECPIDNAA